MCKRKKVTVTVSRRVLAAIIRGLEDGALLNEERAADMEKFIVSGFEPDAAAARRAERRFTRLAAVLSDHLAAE